MSSAAIWMKLDIIILSDAIQTVKDKHHMILLTCGIYKKIMDTNELIGRLKTDSQTLKNLWLPSGQVKEDWHMHTEVYGTIGQEGPAV